jgi:hypothetical protein
MSIIVYKVQILHKDFYSKIVEYDRTGKEPLTFKIKQGIETDFINDDSKKWYKLEIKNVDVKSEYFRDNDTVVHNVYLHTCND